MARNTDIRLRRSATSGAIPTTSALNLGELAINTYDGKLYLKKNVSGTESIVEIGASGGATQQSAIYKEYVYTATNNQTSFSGSDDNSATLSYVVGYLQVFLNGVLLENGTDYTATTSTSVVLVNGANSGDVLQVSTFVKVLGTGDMVTNTFTGNGSTAAYTLSTNPDTEENTIVFVDGVYQEKDTYTVSGTTLTFDANVPNGASIEVIIGSRNVSTLDAADLSISGDLTVDGNTTLGNAATDTVTFTADVASHLIPSADSTFNIGASGTEWANVYADTFTGNLVGNVTGTVSSLSNLDTDNLSEGSSNLYYTDARVDSHLSGGTGVTYSSGTISIGQAVATTDNVTFNNVTVNGTLTSDDITSTNISVAGNATITGNLTVEGTTTTLNTATLDVEDKNITLNYGSGDTSSTADGAGITIQDAVNSTTDATILWDATNDEFDFSHGINVTGATTLSGNLIHAVDLTLDIGGDLIVDVDGDNVWFDSAGTRWLSISQVSSDVYIGTEQNDKDLIFRGKDGSSTITALTLDMSDAGTAIFNHDVKLGANGLVLANGINDSSNGYNLLKRFNAGYTQVGDHSNGFVVRDSGYSGGTVGIGTNSPAVSLDIGSETDALRVPNGTTAQRPTAALGQLRYNTTTSEFEGYADGAWGKIGGGGDSFGTIAVSGQSNVVAEQENDTLTLAAGTGITITTNATSDTVTITNSATGDNAFGNVAVSGQTTVAADSTNDTLTLVGQNGIAITTDASTDTVTIDGYTSYSPFTTDLFTTANTTTTDFVLSVTPSSEDNLIVFVEGVYQNKNSYSLSSSTLTLSGAPGSGEEVVVHIVSDLISGQSLVRNNFTGVTNQTDFTLTLAPMNANNTFVYMDGVYQEKSEYTVSGTTLSFTTAPTAGDSIEVIIPKTTELQQPATASIDDIAMFDSAAIIGSALTSTTLTTTSASTIATHAIATYRSVNYQIQCTQGTDYHITNISVVHDGTTAHFTEYGAVFDNASLGTFDATISSGNLLLQITPGSATNMAVKVVSSAIPV